MNPYRYLRQLPDPDGIEVAEWVDSVDDLARVGGPSRSRRLLLHVLGRAADIGVDLPTPRMTDYLNTIPTTDEPPYPGDEDLERRIRHLIRWNAAVMVARANHRFDGIGGHLATYASAATLYEVGFNHFFHGKADGGFGDQLFIQGHASPGIYARAFLEGRLDEADLGRFRHEVGGGGLPSYPHPRRSDFWEFPTVSMGLGPLTAAYQARFNRYLHHRGIVDTSGAKVWCFVGNGERPTARSSKRASPRRARWRR
jgi:pyruvate dehydrogenase E1 component